MAPIKINFEKILEEVRLRENINKRIRATNTCTSNKDKNDLIQELNKIDVLLLHRDNMAKGERNTNIFIKTYLTAYVITKLNNPTEIRLLIIPSRENISRLSLTDITELSSEINSEKHILLLNRYSPTCLILLDNKDTR